MVITVTVGNLGVDKNTRFSHRYGMRAQWGGCLYDPAHEIDGYSACAMSPAQLKFFSWLGSVWFRVVLANLEGPRPRGPRIVPYDP